METESAELRWQKPWRWRWQVWLALLLLSPLLYFLSLFVAESWAGPKPGWRRNVVQILYSPLEPLRQRFRRVATRPDRLLMPSNCEVCGEVAIVRFWEPVADDPPSITLRSFCREHHRDYADLPADALKPQHIWP